MLLLEHVSSNAPGTSFPLWQTSRNAEAEPSCAGVWAQEAEQCLTSSGCQSFGRESAVLLSVHARLFFGFLDSVKGISRVLLSVPLAMFPHLAVTAGAVSA